ncbi:Ail/Lom family outer membrane beta-barrel protein [Ewingella sp. CoE-038-23]|uniref:Ail/Lom family outer membrane beta-barrel protein n=1 Tax=Ewingella docleensis TaxID=3118588 RepID=UPI00336585CE
MKYGILSLVVLASVGVSSVAKADSQTISMGYAQSKVQDFKNIRGVNAKYRYEWDSRVSILGSFTYMSTSGNLFDSEYNEYTNYDDHIKVKYYSLLVGPAYRINEYVSFYALGGVSKNKIDLSQNYHHIDHTYTENSNNSKTAFAYGAGVQINPTESIAIDVGYEGSKIVDAKNNGFNVGIGYRF